MEAMRESWTDERLDDGFRRTEADIRGLRSEVSDLRTELKGEINGLRAEMNSRFDGLQRTMLQVGGGMIAALIAGFMGLIATQL